MAVGVGVADADHRAVAQAHPARTLHLQEERLDGVVDPDEFGAAQPLLGQFRARPVRHHPRACVGLLQPAAQPQVRQFRIQRRQVDAQQVGRRAAQRHDEGRAAGAAAVQERLVVAGDAAARLGGQHSRLGAAFFERDGQHPIGIEALGEERPLRRDVSRRHRCRVAARLVPDLAACVAAHEAAARGQQRRPGGGEVGVGNLRQHVGSDLFVAGLGQRLDGRRRRRGRSRRGHGLAGPDEQGRGRKRRRAQRLPTIGPSEQTEAGRVADHRGGVAGAGAAGVHRLVDDVSWSEQAAQAIVLSATCAAPTARTPRSASRTRCRPRQCTGNCRAWSPPASTGGSRWCTGTTGRA